jgi:hypothetical protein
MKVLGVFLASVFITIVTYGQNVESITYESWSNDNWVNSSIETCTYDENAYLINRLTETWDEPTSSWGNSTQINYINGDNGNVEQQTLQYWESSLAEWVNFQRTTLTYNSSNVPSIIIIEGYLNDEWVNSQKQTNAYDVNVYLISQINETWNILSSSWENSYRFNYINNDNGTIDQRIYQIWDMEGFDWINSIRANYTYNSSGDPLTILGESFINNDWVNTSKQTNTYDENGYFVNGTAEIWSIPTDSWENSAQINYTNDESGLIQQTVFQLWNSPDLAWDNFQRANFTYQSTTDIGELTVHTDAILVYPNPTNGKINFSIQANAHVANTSGQIVLNENNVNTLDLTNQPAGIYFVTLFDDTSRMLKRLKIFKEY